MKGKEGMNKRLRMEGGKTKINSIGGKGGRTRNEKSDNEGNRQQKAIEEIN